MSVSRRWPFLALLVVWHVPVRADEPHSSAVEVTRAATPTCCSLHVEGAAAKDGDGLATSPHKTIVVAANDPLSVVPVEGESRVPGDSPAAGKGTSAHDLGALKSAKAPSASPGAAATPVQVAEEGAAGENQDLSAREAFMAAKDLGTAKGWQAFLGSFPNGFYADLARAYLDALQPGPNPAAAPSAPKAKPANGDAFALGPNASLGGRRLLPDDSPWHQDISQSPVDPNSEAILARVGLDKTLRADFGTEWEGAPMGIQYVVVSSSQAKVPVSFTYDDESDPGPYPIPPDAPIEGGPNGTGDRHILVLDRDTQKLWELYNAFPDGKGWKADSGAIWDLTKNQIRPARWTSADAAGLPILPGLVRYDEAVETKAIEHALRFTLAKTRRAYLPPASHWASKSFDEDLPPMGMRMRLKADFDVSPFAAEVQVILTALKTYGLILADNGSDNFISGAPDPRWNMDNLRQLMKVTNRDLEVVEMIGLVADEPK